MLRSDRARTIYDVLRLPGVRRIEPGWGASVIGELAGQVTLVVYAFDAGGAVLVATYVACRTLLSMAVMLGITGVAGRAQPGLLLRRLTWLRAVLLAPAALAAFLHGSPGAVIALAAASWLTAAIGAGGLIGGAAATGFVHVHRLPATRSLPPVYGDRLAI